MFSSPSDVNVRVVHPQTVEDDDDAAVALDIRVTSHRVDGMPYEAVLEIRSGVLSVGDADEDDDIALDPGRWLLQFDVDDPDEARYVQLVLSPC